MKEFLDKISDHQVMMLFFLTVVLMFQCGEDKKVCPDASCADYATQQEAQAAFDRDAECMGELDTDNDGIACEHLPSVGSGGCATTSNCGCSGKSKSQCNTTCCAWVVGSGCKCR